jgi:hypothetical protein
MILLAARLAALLLLAGAVRTQAASTTIDCDVDSDAACRLTDSDGLQTVRLTLQTGRWS